MARHAFAPTAALLVESGRRSLAPSAGAVPAPGFIDDWHTLPDIAERHGMSAWVHASLADCFDAPEDVRVRVAERSRLHHLRALHALSLLSTVVELLKRAGIDSVALKGPLFSRWLYGDVGMRRFVDLDLLVDPAERGRALDALGAAGYSLPGRPSAATARIIYAGTGAWPLAHDTDFGIDLHWQLQAVGLGSPFGYREVLTESVTTTVAGSEIRIPAPTHTATLALLHAAKHLWASLELVLSIAHLMRRSDVDWTRVRALAACAGGWNGAAAGLALASELFDVDVPPELRDRIRAGAVRPLVRAALEFMAMPDVASASRRSEVGTHCAALDNTRARLRYAAWRLFVPTPLEAAWIRLPDRLVSLYVPLRLVRLAIRHRERER